MILEDQATVFRSDAMPVSGGLRGGPVSARGGWHGTLPVGAHGWRCIGPFHGGRVVAVAGELVDPMMFYFGVCAGEILSVHHLW